MLLLTVGSRFLHVVILKKSVFLRYNLFKNKL